MPKISIIVPVYGVELFLKQALDSLLNQTFKDLEIILIDDGGKDNCPSIIDEYSKKDCRIKAIHKNNGGYGQACNIGLEEASGEYVAIFEPDDFVDSKMYEDLYNLAIESNADVVKSSFYKYYDLSIDKHIEEIPWNKSFNLTQKSFKLLELPIFLSLHPSIWSCIYKREFLEKNKIRFVEYPGSGWTDNLFQVQTLYLANNIVYTPKAYYYWRCQNQNDSLTLSDYKIPFLRSDEIHEWLEKNNIKDKGLLSNLYKRELKYIAIVLGMKKLYDKKDCYLKIKKMLDRMDKTIVFDTKYFSKKHIKTYKSLRNLTVARIKIKTNQIRKEIIKFKLKKHEKYIVLFGKKLLWCKSA